MIQRPQEVAIPVASMLTCWKPINEGGNLKWL